MDTNKLKELAERATPGPWSAVWEEGDDTAWPNLFPVIQAESGENVVGNEGFYSDLEQDKANAKFIAAANPQAILGLIAEIAGIKAETEFWNAAAVSHLEEVDRLKAENEALRGEVAVYEDGMRSLACNLGAGGFNAGTLTAAQLVDKVQWGVDNLSETQGRLIDEVRAENTELRKTAERYRELRKITPHRLKKLQEAATTDGGDVFYFHADRFDAALDAALEGGGI